jgi:hypothetical protein
MHNKQICSFFEEIQRNFRGDSEEFSYTGGDFKQICSFFDA